MVLSFKLLGIAFFFFFFVIFKTVKGLENVSYNSSSPRIFTIYFQAAPLLSQSMFNREVEEPFLFSSISFGNEICRLESSSSS